MITFVCRYALSDGQAREETGILTQVGENEVYRVSGAYTFQGTDGKTYLVQYTADENGYVAKVSSEESGVAVGDRIDGNLLKTLIGQG